MGLTNVWQHVFSDFCIASAVSHKDPPGRVCLRAELQKKPTSRLGAGGGEGAKKGPRKGGGGGAAKNNLKTTLRVGVEKEKQYPL